MNDFSFQRTLTRQNQTRPYERKTNLCGGSKICRGATGAGVREGGASAAAHRRGWSSTSRGVWDAGGLTQNAMFLETCPSIVPAEEELVQKLNLETDQDREQRDRVLKLAPFKKINTWNLFIIQIVNKIS